MNHWHYDQDEEILISDQERKCPVTAAFGSCINDEVRRAAARRLMKHCSGCVRLSWCFVSHLMMEYYDPEE